MRNSQVSNSEGKLPSNDDESHKAVANGDSENNSVQNLSCVELLNGILEIELQIGQTRYSGTVFANDVGPRVLRSAQSLYEQSEMEKCKIKQRGPKKRGRKLGSRNRRQFIANPGFRGRPARSITALCNKVNRELDEFALQDSTVDIKTGSETTNSPINGKEDFDDDSKSTLDANGDQSSDKKQEEHYSDISDASKDSPASSLINSCFDIENLVRPMKRETEPFINCSTPLNLPPIKVESRPSFGQHANFQPLQNAQQKLTDNYTILKENREMGNICSSIKNRVNDTPRPQTFTSKPLPRTTAPDNFYQRPPTFNPNMMMPNNSQRIASPDDLLKLYQAMRMPSANLNNFMNQSALLAAMCAPGCAFPRGFNPANIPQNSQMPNIPFPDLYNFRPFNFMQLLNRFPPNNQNQRNPGNQNGSNKFTRE